jgi:hypothetical protein
MPDSLSPRFHSSSSLLANDPLLRAPPTPVRQRLTDSSPYYSLARAYATSARESQVCCSSSTIAFMRRALIFTVSAIVIVATFIALHKEITFGRTLAVLLFLLILVAAISYKAWTKYARIFEIVIELTVAFGVPACILAMQSVQSSTFVAMCLVRRRHDTRLLYDALPLIIPPTPLPAPPPELFNNHDVTPETPMRGCDNGRLHCRLGICSDVERDVNVISFQ